MKVTYTGYLSVTYMDYLDLATGRALFAEPGETYDIRAIGYNAAEIPVNNFTLAEEENEDEEPFSQEAEDEDENSLLEKYEEEEPYSAPEVEE